VVSDFRSTDVALGGQGAPLVPCAERFLFQAFTACLNLGGIANISFPQDPEAPGSDLCACNQWLNRLAERMGQAYDKDGALSAQGKIVPELAEQLNALPYYKQSGPRSLGNEDCLRDYKNLLETESQPVPDLLATVLAHVGFQVGRNLPAGIPGTLLLTGGGAFHPGLVAAIRRNMPPGWQLQVPDPRLISFKEAYCFAFLGLRRALNRTNVFAHVTGAKADSISGTLSGHWAS
jgi:anhydro-N-acetylmuramic acid kinase